MQIEELRTDVLRVLDEKKALDIVQIDVQGKTSICDFMLVGLIGEDRPPRKLPQRLYVLKVFVEQNH